ncbi:MAG: hypothetical protein ACFFD4_30355 [Candidatus Odinarchaeota archaeon]
MVVDFLLFPLIIGVDFMYEIADPWKIPAQLLLITGSIVVFILNLTFLKVLQTFTRIIPVTESRIIFRGAVVYAFTAGFLPILIEIIDLLLILSGITAFPAVIFRPEAEGFRYTSPELFNNYKELILLEFLLRDLFFTMNLLGGVLLCVFFAVSISKWRKLLGEKSFTISIMIPGYVCLGLAWVIESIKVNLLYLTPISYFAPLETVNPVLNENIREMLQSIIRGLDIVDGGALVITVICGVLAFIPVFNQLTEGSSDKKLKKVIVSLVLFSPVLLLITLLLGRKELGLGSGDVPSEASPIAFLFIFSIFLPLFLVGMCYYLIGKNLNDPYLKNFMYASGISAITFPWLIGIPEPELWFGTVFTPFVGFLTVGGIYFTGVMAGVNTSVLEHVRERGMEIKFLIDVERAIQIENLARETEKLLRTAVEEIKEKTKVTPQFNPRAYTKAFEIGIQSALNQVDLEQDVDSYIKEALELYKMMISEAHDKGQKSNK